MKSITKTLVSIACVASAASFALAAPKDITTRTNPDSSLNVEARYLVHVGFSGYSGGLTSAVDWRSRGFQEYHSAGGVNGTGNWGRMNNAITVYGNRAGASQDGGFMCATAGGTGTDYFGYLFNAATKPTRVDFWNSMCANGIPGPVPAAPEPQVPARLGGGAGGTFAATPELQYLDAPDPIGAWHTITNVTWNVPYDPTLPTGLPAPAAPGGDASDIVTRAYQITINEPLSNVWGIRLIGAANASGGNTVDPDGYVGVQELAVYGELEIGGADLSKNKARTGTAIAVAEQTAATIPLLNDGIMTAYMTTWHDWPPLKEDYLGVTWASPQHRITALGVALRLFGDGGDWDDCQVPLRIEYTTDGATWIPATGLDKRRYPYLWQRLYYDGDAQTGFLFTFDELNGITGLRVIGDPQGRSGDEDGFVGCYELEVFGIPVMGEIVNYDASADGDVDATDLGLFIDCWSGPAVPYTTTPNCSTRDLDNDGDVDANDFGVFQRCYSGPGVAADPFCG